MVVINCMMSDLVHPAVENEDKLVAYFQIVEHLGHIAGIRVLREERSDVLVKTQIDKGKSHKNDRDSKKRIEQNPVPLEISVQPYCNLRHFFLLTIDSMTAHMPAQAELAAAANTIPPRI